MNTVPKGTEDPMWLSCVAQNKPVQELNCCVSMCRVSACAEPYETRCWITDEGHAYGHPCTTVS